MGSWGQRDGVGEEGKGQRKNGGVKREIEFKRRTQKRASKTQAIVDPLRGKVKIFFLLLFLLFHKEQSKINFTMILYIKNISMGL